MSKLYADSYKMMYYKRIMFSICLMVMTQLHVKRVSSLLTLANKKKLNRWQKDLCTFAHGNKSASANVLVLAHTVIS